MTTTITHAYEESSVADRVIKDLEGAGFKKDQISVVGPGGEDANAAATGAALGGVAGAGAGFLASVGLIAIPGIGPIVAAGVIASMLAGAASGAVAGGVLGALVEYGISEKESQVYAEIVRRGGTLISLRTDEVDLHKAEAIMQMHGPIDVEAREKAYRAEGWSTYDPNAPAYTQAECERERERYRLAH
ncbi:MAG: hypothetical protein WBX25_20355 [Rhodomicrobium sp.]